MKTIKIKELSEVDGYMDADVSRPVKHLLLELGACKWNVGGRVVRFVKI